MNVPGYILHDSIARNNTNLSVHRATKIDGNQKVILKISKQKSFASTNNELVIVSKLAGVKGVPKLLDQLSHQEGACTIFQDDDFVNLSSVVPIKLDTFLPLAVNIARSLGEIHNNLVARLDIKADSIFFNKKSLEVKFVEFSKASVFSRESTRTSNDQRLDLRDLGLTFCHMLSGEAPSKDSATPFQSFKPQPALEHIISKLLSSCSPRPYSTAFSLADDLLRVFKSEVKPPANFDLPWLTDAMTSLRGLTQDEIIKKTTLVLARNGFDRVVILTSNEGSDCAGQSKLSVTAQSRKDNIENKNNLNADNNHHDEEEKEEVLKGLAETAYQTQNLQRWTSSPDSVEYLLKDSSEAEYVKSRGVSAAVSAPFFGSLSGVVYLESQRQDASLLPSQSQSLEAFVAHFAVLLDNASLSQASLKKSKRNFKSAVDLEESAVWGRFYSSLAQSIDKIVIPSIPQSNESDFNILVEKLEDWEFDIFEFDRLCEGLFSNFIRQNNNYRK
eukprot:TRINITY_DN2068_c0_g1_i2.p1 TRINITY_DN2068_c0_g1~~TRINITY_DN2068_c0_g1_i2.p1  ORF type:complete len:519 (-),score=105.98 TRINITY_DN2068_c0_g1_i2:52-1557(-)